jgi:hypothetical protein
MSIDYGAPESPGEMVTEPSVFLLSQPPPIAIKKRIMALLIAFYGQLPAKYLRVRLFKIISNYQAVDVTATLFESGFKDKTGRATNIFPIRSPTLEMKKLKVTTQGSYFYFEFSFVLDDGTFSHVVDSNMFFVTANSHLHDSPVKKQTRKK